MWLTCGADSSLVRRLHLWVLVLYAAVATGLFAPMASNAILPKAPDHANHVAVIAQARAGIEEGQFPLRVAPWQHQGWRYPQFQFYSPLPYEIAGRVYRWITPDNPFVAYKLTLWGAMVLGAFFLYLTAAFLTGSDIAALMAGVAYMSAPYLLVNVHARGAFTEAIAQGLLPLVLYCSLRCFSSDSASLIVGARTSARAWRSPWLPAASIAWACLALTHTITWLCGAMFMGLLFLRLGVSRSPWRMAPGLWRVGVAFTVGCGLAMYVLVPVITADYLTVRALLGHVSDTTWMTSLSTLLSPVSLPPEPQPGHPLETHLHPNIGWPILTAVAIAIEAAWRARANDRVALTLVGLFLLAVILTWSPFDIWLFAPDAANLPQFSYRLLAQVGWTGALIVAFALVSLFGRQLSSRHAAVGILLIVLAHSSFLPQLDSAKITVAQIIEQPDIGYGRTAYLVKTQRLPPDRVVADTLKIPIIYEPARTIGVEATEKACQHVGDALNCHISIPTDANAEAGPPRFVQLPLLFYPSLLDVHVNGQVAPYVPIGHGEYLLASVQLDPGTYDIHARFRGVPWANVASAITWVVTLAALVLMSVRRS